MRRWSHRQELISDKKLRIYYASQDSSKPPVIGRRSVAPGLTGHKRMFMVHNNFSENICTCKCCELNAANKL